MKKLSITILVIVLLFTFAGCGSTAVQESTQTKPVPSESPTVAADAPPEVEAEPSPSEAPGATQEAPAETAPEKTNESLGETGLAAPADSVPAVRSYKNLYPGNSLTASEGNTTFIGYGYDILNQSYIHLEGFSKGRPILKEDEVQKRLLQSDAPAQNSHTIMGQTMKSYCSNFSAELELKSDYPLFTGKITSEFDKDQSTKTNVYFIKSLSLYPTYSEYIKVTSDIKTILDDTFAADLNGTMAPKDLFSTYGTHLVVEDLMGGRCEFNYTYTSTDTQTTSQIKTKVDAAYKFISGSGSVNDKTTATEFLSNSSFTSSLYGGKKIDATTLENLIKNQGAWIDSIDKTTSTICSISNINSLKPIWELATDEKRQEELKNYYDGEGGDIQEFINKMSVITPTEKYIEDIVVLSDKKSDIKNHAPSGYTVIDSDLNKGAGGNYIYFAYDTTNDPAKALTDVRISIGKDYSFSSLYKKDPHDLNTGAGGEYIYLWKTKDASGGKPLKLIQVFYGKDASMPSGYTAVDYNKSGHPADLNKGAGGQYIYLGIKR